MASRGFTQDEAKVDWLLAHQDLWFRCGYYLPKQQIVEAMQADGLYAPRTYWVDVNLHRLIEMARDKRAEILTDIARAS